MPVKAQAPHKCGSSRRVQLRSNGVAGQKVLVGTVANKMAREGGMGGRSGLGWLCGNMSYMSSATSCFLTAWESRGLSPETWHRHARLCITAGSREQLTAPAVPAPGNEGQEL